jgi:hypothetical protein
LPRLDHFDLMALLDELRLERGAPGSVTPDDHQSAMCGFHSKQTSV